MADENNGAHDLSALQAALAMAASGANPMAQPAIAAAAAPPPDNTYTPPAQSVIPPQQNVQPPDIGAQPDLSALQALTVPPSGTPMVQGGRPALTPAQRNAPPRPGLPGIIGLISGLVNPAKGTPAGQMAPTRLDHFENFLGNFLQSLAAGFSTPPGPGYNARSAAAAMQAPYQQAVRNWQLGQGAQAQQAQVESEQAKTAQTAAQTAQIGKTATINIPGIGPITGPVKDILGLAGKTAPAQIRATSAENVARIREGVQIPVPEDIAKMVGMPELAGTAVGKTGWQEINTRLAASGKDLTITDVGSNRVLMRKSTGEVVRNLGQAPGVAAGVARAGAFARAKAQWTPFQTFDDEGNPVTTTAEQAIATGAPSATTWNQIFGPTGQTKSQGQAAGAVASHIPDFKKSIDNLAQKGQLGPVMGRLNTYLTKGYGGDDPDVSEFVTTVGLLKSGAVRAHFGARGGSQILDKFDGLLNTAQTPEALKGSINGIDKFLQTYKNVGTPNAPKTVIPSAKKPQGLTADDLLKKYPPQQSR